MKSVAQIVREHLKEMAKAEIKEAKAEAKSVSKKLEASVRLMLKNGIGAEDIAQATGMTSEQIAIIQQPKPKPKRKK